MESNPQQPQNLDPILWKKVYSVQNLPEKVQKVKRNAKLLWLGVVGGIVIFAISIIAFIPYFGAGTNLWMYLFMGGIFVGITLSTMAGFTLMEHKWRLREIEILKQWYTEEQLVAYEDSASITGRLITLKSTIFALPKDELAVENGVLIDKDSYSIRVQDVQAIRIMKLFKTYIPTFFIRAPTLQVEKPVNLVDFYQRQDIALNNEYALMWIKHGLKKEEMNQVLHVMTSLVPNIKVYFGRLNTPPN